MRHKILDAVGDLALAGAPLIGHFRGVRCGHEINNRLLRTLFADSTAWTMVDMQPTDAGTSPTFLSRPAAAAPA